MCFSPEDLNIIKNGPAERRRFINLELSQIDKVYLHTLTKYNKVLNQRNNLLKQIEYKRDLLDTLYIWDDKLIKYGIIIIDKRDEFIKNLNLLVNDIHKKLTGGKEELIIKYEANVRKEEFEDKLKRI